MPVPSIASESNTPYLPISGLNGVYAPAQVDASRNLLVATLLDAGTATAGGAATLTDSAKDWGTNLLAGFLIRITGGPGVGQTRQIASNTATAITVSANWTTQPSTDSTYAIFLSATITATGTDNLAQVNGAAVNVGEGAAGTGTQRVSIATAGIPPTAAAIAAAIANPDAVTFNAPVAINAGAAAYTNLGRTASELTRLHELSVRPNVTDTIILYSCTNLDGSGSGADKVELCRWVPAATGPAVIPHRAEAVRCFATGSGKYLLLYTATATLTGFAITSHKAT
jgi:hypothetical protein